MAGLFIVMIETESSLVFDTFGPTIIRASKVYNYLLLYNGCFLFFLTT